jgi:hypothetical protein
MQIGDQLNSIIESIVNDIKAKVDESLSSTIQGHIARAIDEYDLDKKLTELADPKISKKISEYPIDVSSITAEITQTGQAIIAEFKDVIAVRVNEAAKEHVANFNVEPVIQQAVSTYLKKISFPKNSINSESINLENFSLSGDHIIGGIITQFASTGIDDKATACQLTILDNAVVIEQPILTNGIQVKGSAKIEANLIVNNISVTGAFNDKSEGVRHLLAAVENNTLDNIAQNGIAAPKLMFGDKTLIDSDHLASSILTSNLRKVGTLEGLQTRGETLLDNTLYVAKKRVGINTLEPTYALSVWDEEIEFAVGKSSLNRAFVGTHRPFAITLGAAGKENISLDVDGSVTINDLRLGALPIGTASMDPTWAGRTGEIAFNDNPKIGQPIGWVCLEGHRWAKFGIISE